MRAAGAATGIGPVLEALAALRFLGSVSRRSARAGHICTACRASFSSHGGTGIDKTTGKPVLSRWISSGTRWAQSPCPSHRTQSTMSCLASVISGPSGSGSMPRTGRPQDEWKTCAARSSVKTSSAESTNLVVPSGCPQAPRPLIVAAARRATSSASMPPEPSTIAASARAIVGSPSLHGPHWPADSPAR